MKVVVHHAEGDQLLLEAFHRFDEDADKRFVITRFVENDLAPVPTIKNVVKASCGNIARWARHGSSRPLQLNLCAARQKKGAWHPR
jgi:hypothetical protein